jgi:predicted  nucleic acid-binding Zn-ribbon protein
MIVMTNEVGRAWCVTCGGRYTAEEIEGRTSCPGCGSRGVPCDPSKDVAVEINWHELRILVMWAANWAENVCAKQDAPGNNSPATIQAIARRLQEQHPDLADSPLTMQGELAGLRQAFGQVDAVGIGNSQPIPLNGPGAVGHSNRVFLAAPAKPIAQKGAA